MDRYIGSHICAKSVFRNSRNLISPSIIPSDIGHRKHFHGFEVDDIWNDDPPPPSSQGFSLLLLSPVPLFLRHHRRYLAIHPCQHAIKRKYSAIPSITLRENTRIWKRSPTHFTSVLIIFSPVTDSPLCAKFAPHEFLHKMSKIIEKRYGFLWRRLAQAFLTKLNERWPVEHLNLFWKPYIIGIRATLTKTKHPQHSLYDRALIHPHRTRQTAFCWETYL